MTCIVGIKYKNSVLIAGDSACSDDTIKFNQLQPKVFSVDNRFIVGVAGGIRYGEVIRFAFNPPPQKKNESNLAYMTITFMAELRKTMHKHGCSSHRDGSQGYDGEMLVGYKDSLYKITEDFGIMEAPKYDCSGSGSIVAFGVLYTLNHQMALENASQVLQGAKIALEAAVTHARGVTPPFHYEVLENGKTVG